MKRLLLLIWIAVGGAAPASDGLPRIVLTRSLDHGSAEILTLRCVPDTHGKQEFFCELTRHRNGVEVASRGLYSVETTSLLEKFFERLPASLSADDPSGDAGEVLTWDVSFRDRAAQGRLVRGDVAGTPRTRRGASRNNLLDAVLSLEGALSSQLYR